MPNAFAPGPEHPAPLFAGAALLDAEKLDVYRIALEFQAITGQLVPKRGYAELRDQLERASVSIVLWPSLTGRQGSLLLDGQG
jgi:hypothetical protein